MFSFEHHRRLFPRFRTSKEKQEDTEKVSLSKTGYATLGVALAFAIAALLIALFETPNSFEVTRIVVLSFALLSVLAWFLLCSVFLQFPASTE